MIYHEMRWFGKRALLTTSIDRTNTNFAEPNFAGTKMALVGFLMEGETFEEFMRRRLETRGRIMAEIEYQQKLSRRLNHV
jgi:hypothetical protein